MLSNDFGSRQFGPFRKKTALECDVPQISLQFGIVVCVDRSVVPVVIPVRMAAAREECRILPTARTRQRLQLGWFACGERDRAARGRGSG
jgi:hypothetical protein